MRSHSLIGRMVAVVLLVESVCAAALCGAALLHERRTRLHALDVTLQGRSDSVLGAIQDAEDPEDNITVDLAELRVPGEDVYAVYTGDGRRLGGSADAPAPVIERRGDGFSDRGRGRQQFRVLERSALRMVDREDTKGGGLARPVTIVYAARMNHVWHETLEAARYYLLASLALLVVTAGAMILLLKRVLQPIHDLAAEAKGISPRALHFVAPESALRVRELTPLAETLTGAIGGLRTAREKEHRFVSDAAHELKTAVAVVRSTIQVMMMRMRTPEEYIVGLERALEDNVRTEELIGRMLTLGRAEESLGGMAEVADLGVGVRAAEDKLRSFADARGVNLRAVSAAGVRVPMAPEKVETLLANLIVNAVQHSGPGSHVEISVAVHEGQGVLSVKDWGAGISQEALPHVFERFFREDRSRSRETGGAGLGLAICKSIVESAGGTLRIESTLNVGTTVSAFFRLA